MCAAQFPIFSLFFYVPIHLCFSSVFSPFSATLFDGYIYGWLTNPQAVLSNQTRFVYVLLDNVGHLP